MKTLAVVVTYNKFEDLNRCLDSILNQTIKVDEVLIFNNGDSRRFEQIVQTKFLNHPLITIHHSENNLGGAGGFHYGLNYAHTKGFDYAWLMDDDGWSDSNQLRNLMQCIKQHNLKIAGSLILTNKQTISFRIGNFKVGEKYKQANQTVILDWVNAFNGTLIEIEIIAKIGNIKKEMFIWGDEIEYMLRAKKLNLRIGTCLRAIHYHPDNKHRTAHYLFGLLSISLKPDSYFGIYYRNKAYINLHYFGFFYAVGFYLKHLSYYAWTFEINKLFALTHYYICGLTNKFYNDL